MATLTIRGPEAHRERLAAMAAQRGVSVNELMEELSIRALTEHDTEMRFRLRAARWQSRARIAGARQTGPYAFASRRSLRHANYWQLALRSTALVRPWIAPMNVA